jgi:hypothetical protein
LASSKQRYWCLYDYGTGELLLRMEARAADEIRTRYPQLEVLDGPPPWFEEQEAADPHRYPTYDVDAEPVGALRELAAIEQAARTKRHYYAEYREANRVLRRRIWAASLADIETRYPQLDVVPMVVAPAEAWAVAPSDIDAPDDFLRLLVARA